MHTARNVASTVVAAAVVAACGGNVSVPGSSSSRQDEDASEGHEDASPSASDSASASAQVVGGGTISAQVELPAGTNIAASAYILRGPNGFLRSATLDFSGNQPVAFTIDQIPPASGYTLDATVVAANDALSCAGSALFDIAGMRTTFVTLIAQCSGPAPASVQYGAVAVTVDLPAGIPLSTVEYFLSGAWTAGIDGDIDVANATQATFLIDDVRVGSGIDLALSATSTDGANDCGGATVFDVAEGQTTQTSVTLACEPSPAAPH